MRSTPPTDDTIHMNLFNQHWSRSILPGAAGVLRLYADYGLINRSRKGLIKVLTDPGSRPLGFLGLVSADDRELRDLLQNRGIPAVNVSSTKPPIDMPGVFVDNRAVGRMAAEHLLELGPRHFACLDVGDSHLSNLRCQGFQERIKEAFPEQEVPRLTGEGASFAPALKALPKPVALFCVTDNRAREAANAAFSHGIKIPTELAIVGVDNDPFECEVTRVPLSSVVIPFEEIGAKAMELLLEMLKGVMPDQPITEIPPSHVETRLSSDPMFFEDGLVNRAIRLLRQPQSQSINVAGLAETLGVSRRTLEIHFRKAGAGRVHGIIHEMRLQRAAGLLKSTRLTVAEVSRQIGIQDFRRFGQLFHERFGQTPGQFRKSEICGPDVFG